MNNAFGINVWIMTVLISIQMLFCMNYLKDIRDNDDTLYIHIVDIEINFFKKVIRPGLREIYPKYTKFSHGSKIKEKDREVVKGDIYLKPYRRKR